MKVLMQSNVLTKYTLLSNAYVTYEVSGDMQSDGVVIKALSVFRVHFKELFTYNPFFEPCDDQRRRIRDLRQIVF